MKELRGKLDIRAGNVAWAMMISKSTGMDQINTPMCGYGGSVAG